MVHPLTLLPKTEWVIWWNLLKQAYYTSENIAYICEDLLAYDQEIVCGYNTVATRTIVQGHIGYSPYVHVRKLYFN